MKFRNYNNYEVYEDGRIWSYKRNKWLKPTTNNCGYQKVALTDNEGNKKYYLLHRVIFESVTGEPIPQGYDINHRSEVKTENFFANLQLLSHKENINYGTRNIRSAKAISKANKNNIKLSKAVGAFKDGKIVMVFQSTMEAQRQGFYSSKVSECCNGKRKTHKGFQWKYI